jgi:hypothetical protein
VERLERPSLCGTEAARAGESFCTELWPIRSRDSSQIAQKDGLATQLACENIEVVKIISPQTLNHPKKLVLKNS